MSLEEIKNLVNDRSVLLVGNSVEIMNYELAEFIDSHDIVVRFGKAITADKIEQKSVGKKIDIWVTGSFRLPLVKTDFMEEAHILFNRSRPQLNKVQSIDEESLSISKKTYNFTEMFSDIEIETMNELYGIDSNKLFTQRFSGGLWTIKYFTQSVKTQKSLSIIGFDFFKKYTNRTRSGNFNCYSWHRPIGVTETENVHSGDLERQIVEKIEKDGDLEWIKLSNESKELIINTKYGKF